MAEQSGFFDAHLVDGEYDRIYLAEHFAKYFASFIGNGVFGGKSNELMVREKETPSMGVRVLSGQAWIDGYWYENDSEHSLTIDIADGVLHRIDSIVVRWNHSQRIIRLAVKKGVAATNPVAPIVQRDDDFYELKLADIYIKAGTTNITQSSITDKRYHSEECGLVIGVVQQLDAEEFGIQLDTFIEEFIAEHNAWKNATQADINRWSSDYKASCTEWFNTLKTNTTTSVNNLLLDNQARIDKLLSDGTTNINKVVSDGTTNINNLISTKTAQIDKLISDKEAAFNETIAELEQIAADNNLVELNRVVNTLKENVDSILEEGTGGMGTEDEIETGCFYVMTPEGVKEWINPPNRPGVEYRLTERWNGLPVHSRVIYSGALSNKTVMSIEIEAEYNKIISVAGYAYDPENNMSYPFPIILNGLTPIAVISGVEGNGEVSYIIVNVNEDLSAFSGYFTVKYTK